METMRESNALPEGLPDQTTYDHRGIIRISSFATILAWAFIVLAFLILLFGLYTLYSLFSYQPYIPNFLSLVPGILAISFCILLCLFFAAQLFASAERLFVLTDIEENTQPSHLELDVLGGVDRNKGAA